MNGMVVRRSPVIIGRERELDLLGAALDESVADARPVVVLISGEAGIGKSRLAEAACRAAEDRGMWTLTGRCIASGGEIMPVAAMRDLAIELIDLADEFEIGDITDGDARALRRLIPGHVCDDDSPFAPARLIDLVLGAIRSVARTRPTLVVVEDLHWADETTCRFIVALVSARWLGSVTIAITFRADELHRRHPALPVIEDIVRAVRPLRLELEPLGNDEVRLLCCQLRGSDLDASVIERVQRRTDGNPFLVEELLGSSDSATVSDTLRGVLLGRAASLDGAAIRVLQIVALAGTVRAEVLGNVCGLDTSRLADVIDSLRRAGILRQRTADIAFRHELSREVFADVAPGRRTELHAALADALSTAPEPRPGEIARHWLSAGDQPRALVTSIAAARDALAVGAAAEALAHFGNAIDLWPRVDRAEERTGTDRAQLLLDAAEAALHANRRDDGIDLAERGLGEVCGADVDREIEILLRLRTLYRYQNRWDDCARVVDRLGRLIPSSPPSRARALWLTYAALECSYRNEDGSALAEEAMAAAEACGDLEALVEARCAATFWMPVDRELEHVEVTERLCERGVRPEFALRALSSRIIALMAAARYDDARHAAIRGFQLARATGLAGPHGPNMGGCVVLNEFLLGDWDAACEFASRHADLIGEDFEVCLDLIAARRGELDGLPAAVARLREQSDRGNWREGLGGCAGYVAELAVAAGIDLDLITLTEDTFSQIENGLTSGCAAMLATVIDALTDRVDAGGGAQRRSIGAGLTARVTAWIERYDDLVPNPSADDRPFIQHARAALLKLRGVEEPSAWESVASTYASNGLVYEEALVRYRAAQSHLAGERGRSIAAHDHAAEQARHAAAIAIGLGARPLLERIAKLQQIANLDPAVTPCLPAAQSAPSSDSYGLTDREREILTLVAKGQTNGEIAQQLFISTKTASSHVSNILRKLGVANRVEAATTAQRHHLLLEH
jgi:DNA-binding CsgD family transcriptional regulator/DNA-binding Lrp family transcriptional regulator